jgi:hypothetical protein
MEAYTMGFCVGHTGKPGFKLTLSEPTAVNLPLPGTPEIDGQLKHWVAP